MDADTKPRVFKMADSWVWTCCDNKIGRTFTRPTGAWDCAVVTATDHWEHMHNPQEGEEIGGEEERRV